MDPVVFKVCLLGTNNEIKNTLVFSDATNQQIHMDDSISTVKNKILREIGLDTVSYKELYLFAYFNETLPLFDAYNDVTDNGELPLTYETIVTILKNTFFTGQIDAKDPDIYTYEDLVGIYKGEIIKGAIGREYKNKTDYLFSINPFQCSKVTKRSIYYTLDSSVLLNFGPIIDNTIYVCLAEDVFEYSNANNIDSAFVSEMYFPFLFASDIKKRSDLLSRKQELISESKRIITDDTWKLYETVDMFYNIYHKRGANIDLQYHKDRNGIKSFDIGIKTDYINLLPLDSIFKNIHSIREIPFIKYNPGFRRENMYRLYSEKTSTKGRKIPLLAVNDIIRLSKETGKSSEISLYAEIPFKTGRVNMYIDFQKDGSMRVHASLATTISQTDLHELLESGLNPIIDNINGFIEHIGYKIQRYTSLDATYVSIYNIEYIYSIALSHPIKLDAYRKCISSIFIVEGTDIDSETGAKLRFKRVNNYQEMDDIDEYISTERNKYSEVGGIINAVMKEFSISEDIARNRAFEFFKKHPTQQSKTAENSGFPVTMKLIPSDKRLNVTMSSINAIAYIDIIRLYIDSILRIFQSPKTSGVPMSEIQAVCKRNINFGEVEKRKFEAPLVIVPELEVSEEVFDSDFFSNKKVDDTEVDDDDTDDFGMDMEGGDGEDSDDIDKYDGGLSNFGMDLEGGGVEGEDDELEVKLDGVKLKNPNPLQARIEKMDGDLVLKSQQGKFRPFSRTCRAEVNLQPVVLSDAEKERIDREHPGSYTTAIKTGSKPDKQNWYICPRYWSLKTNSSLTQEEVNEILKTQPNALIPYKATVVPKGGFIYEIAHPTQHFNEKGEYIPHYPGLITESHPDGYDIPCCRRRPPKVVDPVEKEKEKDKERDTNLNTYIVESNKYPIQHNRWGFLPLPVQMFFQIENSKCVSKSNTAVIKQNKPCLLRYGVEHSILQSFIACFADIYASDNNISVTPTIEEMRKIIINAITIDRFLEYNNSSLSAIFRPPSTYVIPDISLYNNTDFIQFIDETNENEVHMRNNIIGAYENFIRFLSDDSAHIDHTYMWCIVSRPNPKLFKKGLNLAILQLSRDSDFIDLICPRNAYSHSIYDVNKGTVILLKQDVFYEPVYLYENKDGTLHDVKIFHKMKADAGIKSILTRIENLTGKHCKPKNSIPQIYKYSRGLNQIDTMSVLQDHGYTVKHQVINYQFKTVGFNISFGIDSIFVPCSPSPVIESLYDFVYIYEDDIWHDYEYTVKMLNQVNERTKGKLKCEPIKKVLDKNMVIGFLTETNQFIKINPAIDLYKHVDEIEVVRSSDYIKADESVTINTPPDTTRISTMKNINLESQFYSAFRSTIRILLSYYENRKVKLDIIGLLENRAYKYNQKLKRIDQLLRNMTTEDIKFEDMDVSAIGDVTSCITNCATKLHCLSKEDGKCAMKIPLHNLLTQRDNSIVYYGKIADELIRFHRIRSFILEPKNYLNLSNVDYKINDNEILLLDSTINSDYLNDRNVFNVDEYIQNISYDIAEPDKTTQHYSNADAM